MTQLNNNKNYTTEGKDIETLAWEFISLWEEGLTYDEIGKLYDKGRDFIYKTIKNSGVLGGKRLCKSTLLELRGEVEIICKRYQEGQTAMALAEEFKVSDGTILAILKNKGVKRRPVGTTTRYPLLFETITNEVEAYTLGLITADGSVGDNYAISIDLQEPDKEVLEEINRRLLKNLSSVKLTHVGEERQPLAYLRFGAKDNVKRLEKFGIVPRKTYSLQKLTDLVPEELYHHYIRGLFDGDGVCSFHKERGLLSLGFCAHNEGMVTDFSEQLFKRGVVKTINKLFNTGNCFHIRWGAKSDVYSLYSYMYKDATIFLKRKKEKIEKYL